MTLDCISVGAFTCGLPAQAWDIGGGAVLMLEDDTPGALHSAYRGVLACTGVGEPMSSGAAMLGYVVVPEPAWAVMMFAGIVALLCLRKWGVG